MIFYRCDMCNKELRSRECFNLQFEDKSTTYHLCFDCYQQLHHRLSEYSPRCGNCKYFCHGITAKCAFLNRPADAYSRCSEWEAPENE